MTFEDLDDVMEIERAVFSVPWTETGFFSFMIREGTVFLVAVEEGRICGYCGFVSAADEADITNVAVDPACRRRGTGGKLIGALLAEASELGIRQMFLEVRQSNTAAIGLYRKFGFCDAGIRKNYYEEPAEDALVMKKEFTEER